MYENNDEHVPLAVSQMDMKFCISKMWMVEETVFNGGTHKQNKKRNSCTFIETCHATMPSSWMTNLIMWHNYTSHFPFLSVGSRVQTGHAAQSVSHVSWSASSGESQGSRLKKGGKGQRSACWPEGDARYNESNVNILTARQCNELEPSLLAVLFVLWGCYKEATLWRRYFVYQG